MGIIGGSTIAIAGVGSIIGGAVAAVAIIEAIHQVITLILFTLSKWICQVVDLCYEMFRMFSGLSTVTYKGEESYLLNIFIGSSTIQKVYWVMAGIGIALTFGFAIAGVIRKMFDVNDKHEKMTLGGVLGSSLKTVLLICGLTLIITASLYVVETVARTIDNAFDMAQTDEVYKEITFDEEDYGTMFAILDTIANYGNAETRDTRVNINSCFNDIRQNLQFLDKKGAFDFTYDDPTQTKNIVTWQYQLRKIVLAADIYEEMPIDSYNVRLTEVLTETMDILENDASFCPLSHYEYYEGTGSAMSSLGRVIMLCGTYEAAENDSYNQNAELTDSIRGPFYSGEKDIYDRDEVQDYFDIDFFNWDYFITIVGGFLLLLEFVSIVVSMGARLFNILLLYLAGPLFLATSPFDEGEKSKQWSIAFMIQAVGFIGTMIALRLVVMLIPLILSPKLVLFADSTFANWVAKLVLVGSALLASQGAQNLITGILADQAGFQSMLAGEAAGKQGSAMFSSMVKAPFKLAGWGISKGWDKLWDKNGKSGGGNSESGSQENAKGESGNTGSEGKIANTSRLSGERQNGPDKKIGGGNSDNPGGNDGHGGGNDGSNGSDGNNRGGGNHHLDAPIGNDGYGLREHANRGNNPENNENNNGEQNNNPGIVNPQAGVSPQAGNNPPGQLNPQADNNPQNQGNPQEDNNNREADNQNGNPGENLRNNFVNEQGENPGENNPGNNPDNNLGGEQDGNELGNVQPIRTEGQTGDPAIGGDQGENGTANTERIQTGDPATGGDPNNNPVSDFKNEQDGNQNGTPVTPSGQTNPAGLGNPSGSFGSSGMTGAGSFAKPDPGKMSGPRKPNKQAPKRMTKVRTGNSRKI